MSYASYDDVELLGMIGTSAVSEVQTGSGPAIDLDYTKRFARAHEDGGFDRVLIGYGSGWAEGSQVAAYVAQHTERLGLLIAHRPGVVHPTLAARTFSTLDQFSQGRVALNIVTGSTELLDKVRIEAAFQFERGALLTPGPSKEPSGPVDRVLKCNAVPGISAEKCRLRLRLPLSAHRSICHYSAILEHCQGGVQGMKGLPSRLESIGAIRRQREAGSAILPGDTGVRKHDPRPELKISRLDAAHHLPATVCCAEPSRVPMGRRSRPSKGTIGVDRIDHRLQSSLVIEEGLR